jgi:hypothetical protein
LFQKIITIETIAAVATAATAATISLILATKMNSHYFFQIENAFFTLFKTNLS